LLVSEAGYNKTFLDWLLDAAEELESISEGTRMEPEIYVTIAQLYSASLMMHEKGIMSNSDLNITIIARRAIECLEIAVENKGLTHSFLEIDIYERGWCGLIKMLKDSENIC